MTEHTTFSDRDVLVRIDTRLDGITKAFDEFKSEMRNELAAMRDRITVLERTEDRRTGATSMAKWIWGAIGAIPSGVLVWFFSRA